ncbi:MAG TPA: WG repeat-containing protein [Clostridium sp.]
MSEFEGRFESLDLNKLIMKKCMIYHTGVYESADGVLKDNKVYLQGKDDKLYFPEEMFMAREECEGGLIQFEVEGKWGFADIYTGEIIIEPSWDYAGPFYRGYAHVAMGVQLEVYNEKQNYVYVYGGKHGYIDTAGNSVIPIEYDDALDMPDANYFKAVKHGKWWMVDKQNIIITPLEAK